MSSLPPASAEATTVGSFLWFRVRDVVGDISPTSLAVGARTWHSRIHKTMALPITSLEGAQAMVAKAITSATVANGITWPLLESGFIWWCYGCGRELAWAKIVSGGRRGGSGHPKGGAVQAKPLPVRIAEASTATCNECFRPQFGPEDLAAIRAMARILDTAEEGPAKFFRAMSDFKLFGTEALGYSAEVAKKLAEFDRQVLDATMTIRGRLWARAEEVSKGHPVAAPMRGKKADLIIIDELNEEVLAGGRQFDQVYRRRSQGR